ncbi:hypothetical protein JDV09_25365 [Mycobacterium sp. Y57]|nr:hypothetical protein [Mycolicibacterium xanthum]
MRRFGRTTPGVLSIIAVAVAVACVITGIVCSAQLGGRIAGKDRVLDQSEPFAFAAQNLYAALSAADAAAATGFLSGGVELPQVRARYQQALADASSALADVTAGTGDAETRTAVADISAQLNAYTGLVESARANNRQGFPIGAAYLREASSLMQDGLLPGAEKVFTGSLAGVEQGQDSISALPTLSLVLLFLVLVAIVIGSLIAARRTNRVFNLGLVAAAGAVLLAMVWILGVTRLAAGDIAESRVDGTDRFEHLAQARILAQQVRTEETLQLIARGDITSSEESVDAGFDDLTAMLSQGPETAAAGLESWQASHRGSVQSYLGGDYPAAVDLTVGGAPTSSAAHFTAVEDGLRDEIAQTRDTMRDRVSAAGAWLAWSPTGTLVLMVLAAAAALVGLWPRLKEFL